MDLHTYPKAESECGQDQTFGTKFHKFEIYEVLAVLHQLILSI